MCGRRRGGEGGREEREGGGRRTSPLGTSVLVGFRDGNFWAARTVSASSGGSVPGAFGGPGRKKPHNSVPVRGLAQPVGSECPLSAQAAEGRQERRASHGKSTALTSAIITAGALALALAPAFWPSDAAAHTCDAPFTTDLITGPPASTSGRSRSATMPRVPDHHL